MKILGQDLKVTETGKWTDLKEKYPEAATRLVGSLPPEVDTGKFGRTWVLEDSVGEYWLAGKAGLKLFAKESPPQVFALVKKHGGKHNLASMADIRDDLKHLTRDEQDAAIRKAIQSGEVVPATEEGRLEVSERQRAAHLLEADDPLHPERKIRYGYLMIRNSNLGDVMNEWIPVENVFCKTGKGGGVDPTCKLNEGDSDALRSWSMGGFDVMHAAER